MSQRLRLIPRVLCFVFYMQKLLLIKGSERKEWAGWYDPVGGHIEAGETVTEAARREIREETGLEVGEINVAGMVQARNFFGKDIMMFVTVCHSPTDQVTAGDEGELVWVEMEALNQVKVFADIEKILGWLKNLETNPMFEAVSRFGDDGQLLEWRANPVAVGPVVKPHNPAEKGI